MLEGGKVGSSWLRLWKKRGLMREFGAPVVELEGGAGSGDGLLGVRTGLERLVEEEREAECCVNLCACVLLSRWFCSEMQEKMRRSEDSQGDESRQSEPGPVETPSRALPGALRVPITRRNTRTQTTE